MTSAAVRSAVRDSVRENKLVYALWSFGFLGVAGVMLSGWQGPIANRDFISFWVAGKLATAGHAVQSYDPETLRAAAKSLAGTTAKAAFPYPPQMLLLAVPLSLLPLKISFFVWNAFSAALFYLAARHYVPTGVPRVIVLLTPSAVASVSYGQVGLFYGALWLFAFRGSALAAAMLTFKPHLGALVAFEMIRRRRVVQTCLIAGALIGLSALVFGVEAWRASVLGAVNNQVKFIVTGEFSGWYHLMTTPYLGFGVVGWLLSACTAAFLLFRNFNVFTAATAVFLISPYGFSYDMTVVCLGFGFLLFERWRSMPAWQCLVCGLAFLSPMLVWLGTWIVPPVLLLGLYVQTIQLPTRAFNGRKWLGRPTEGTERRDKAPNPVRSRFAEDRRGSGQ